MKGIITQIAFLSIDCPFQFQHCVSNAQITVRTIVFQ